MYKITYFEADGGVDISLICDENADKTFLTRWELYSSEIDLGDIENEFENKPTEEEIREVVTDVFRRYVESVIGTYTVEQMNMCVFDENDSMTDDEGLSWEEIFNFTWGKITDLCVEVTECEIEEV